jgi:hypothetical protein
MMWLRVEEEPEHPVLPSLVVNIEVEDEVPVDGESRELYVLQILKPLLKRDHVVYHDGKPVARSVDIRIQELRRRGAKPVRSIKRGGAKT